MNRTRITKDDTFVIQRELADYLQIHRYSSSSTELLHALEAPADKAAINQVLFLFNRTFLDDSCEFIRNFKSSDIDTIKNPRLKVKGHGTRHPVFYSAFIILKSAPRGSLKEIEFDFLKQALFKVYLSMILRKKPTSHNDHGLLSTAVRQCRNIILNILAFATKDDLLTDDISSIAVSSLNRMIRSEGLDSDTIQELQRGFNQLFDKRSLVTRKKKTTRKLSVVAVQDNFGKKVTTAIERTEKSLKLDPEVPINRILVPKNSLQVKVDNNQLGECQSIGDEDIIVVHQRESQTITLKRKSRSFNSPERDADFAKNYLEVSAFEQLSSSSQLNRLPSQIVSNFFSFLSPKLLRFLAFPFLFGLDPDEIFQQITQSLSKVSTRVTLRFGIVNTIDKSQLVLSLSESLARSLVTCVPSEVKREINQLARRFAETYLCMRPTFDRIRASNKSLIAPHYSHPLIPKILRAKLTFDAIAQQSYYYFTESELNAEFSHVTDHWFEALSLGPNDIRIETDFGSVFYSDSTPDIFNEIFSSLTSRYTELLIQMTYDIDKQTNLQSNLELCLIVQVQLHMALLFFLNLRSIGDRVEIKLLSSSVAVLYEKDSKIHREKSLVFIPPRVKELIEIMNSAERRLYQIAQIQNFRVTPSSNDFFPFEAVQKLYLKEINKKRLSTSRAHTILEEWNIRTPEKSNSHRHFLANFLRKRYSASLVDEFMHHKNSGYDATAFFSSADISRLENISNDVSALITAPLIGEK